jgi:hypothetical protein
MGKEEIKLHGLLTSESDWGNILQLPLDRKMGRPQSRFGHGRERINSWP